MGEDLAHDVTVHCAQEKRAGLRRWMRVRALFWKEEGHADDDDG